MKLLALDCSTSSCSVALLDATGQQPHINRRSEQASRQHTQRLLPMVDELLADCGVSLRQLDAIAVGRGPGSFTGLRIALSAAQGLAYGADLPVMPVSTLAAQAQRFLAEWQSDEECVLLSTIDARMDEVYWALYQSDVSTGGLRPIGEEQLTAPEALPSPDSMPSCLEALATAESMATRSLIALGSGHHYHRQMPAATADLSWHPALQPDAAAIAELALRDVDNSTGRPASQAIPVYLRDQVAWQKQPSR